MAKSKAPPSDPSARLIPLALIDEPDDAQRETMDEAALADLALSIRTEGLIHALRVKPNGDRWKVVGGHRRLLACRIVGLDPVPCTIRKSDDPDDMAVMDAENAFREDVNPVEQARWYQRRLETDCNNDVDLLCLKVHRKREFVEDRLLLLLGHETVIEALHQRKISMAVARELNKCKQPIRLRLLLDTAISQGATARQVAEWRKQYDGEPDIQLASSDPADQETNPVAIPLRPFMQCLFCEDSENTHLMEIVYLHKPCARIVLKMLGRLPEQQQQPTPQEPAA